jgi:plasmid stabilization system protein ParE
MAAVLLGQSVRQTKQFLQPTKVPISAHTSPVRALQRYLPAVTSGGTQAGAHFARECHEIVPPVRIHPIGSHLIVCTLDDHGEILILRVRHGHEDWQWDAD